MSRPLLKFLRLPHGEGLDLPRYATRGAAAMDVCSAEDAVLPGQVCDNPDISGYFNIAEDLRQRIEFSSKSIRTGFAIEIPEGYEIQVRSRSGMSFNHQVIVLNAPGTIDSDYRGEILVMLKNLGPNNFKVNRGDRIAQMVLSKVSIAEPEEVQILSETIRGTGGFGSTGR